MPDDSARDPDIELMLRVRAGDRAAFEQLVIKHQKAVINAVYRYTGNPSVAEELAQEAFLRVFRAASDYSPAARFTTWLFTIVRNLCANYRTREGKHDQDMESQAEIELVSSQSDPEELAIRSQLRRKIRLAIAELPESLRMPLILSHYHHISYEEIAKIMELTNAAVKVRIHRAKLMLANKLLPPVTGSVAGGLHK